MAEAATKTRLESAIVARGHCVWIPDESGKKVFAGRKGQTYEEIFTAPVVEYGPGSVVELPAEEVRRLRVTGHLDDPNARLVPTQNTVLEEGTTLHALKAR